MPSARMKDVSFDEADYRLAKMIGKKRVRGRSGRSPDRPLTRFLPYYLLARVFSLALNPATMRRINVCS